MPRRTTYHEIYISVTLWIMSQSLHVRRVWRYQRGNQNPKIEGPTTQLPNWKGQFTKHYRINLRPSNTNPTTIGDELICSGRMSCFRPTSGICRATLVTNLVISNEWWKDREVLEIHLVCTKPGIYMRNQYRFEMQWLIGCKHVRVMNITEVWSTRL